SGELLRCSRCGRRHDQRRAARSPGAAIYFGRAQFDLSGGVAANGENGGTSRANLSHGPAISGRSRAVARFLYLDDGQRRGRQLGHFNDGTVTALFFKWACRSTVGLSRAAVCRNLNRYVGLVSSVGLRLTAGFTGRNFIN